MKACVRARAGASCLQVFNSLGGPDVYDGMWADYAGTEVTADNFFAALQVRDVQPRQRRWRLPCTNKSRRTWLRARGQRRGANLKSGTRGRFASNASVP